MREREYDCGPVHTSTWVLFLEILLLAMKIMISCGEAILLKINLQEPKG